MGISGRIARYFQGSQLTPLIALVLFLLGLFAVLVTPKEEEPQINVTMANVLVPFPGASAKDVESLVAIPAEQVISRIRGIDHVYSVSKPGMAVLTAQFKVGVPHEQALVLLYDTIFSHRDWLSPNLGVGEPIIKPKGIDDVPIVTLTFWTTDPLPRRLRPGAGGALRRDRAQAGGRHARRLYHRRAEARGARHRRARADERLSRERTGHPRRRCSCPTRRSPPASW